MNINKSIILVGIKHCGKSTQGKALALKLGVAFFDTDIVIEELTGKSAREIYNTEGKDSFLSAEQTACRHLNSIIKSKPSVIATGGGICDNEEALRFLNTNSVFVYLCIDEETAVKRILNEAKTDGEKITDVNSLPSYIAKKNPSTISDVRTFFHSFYTERTKKYEMLADFTIEQGTLSADEITKKIESLLR